MKILRTIYGLTGRAEVTNKEVYERAKIKLVLYQLYLNIEKFFRVQKHYSDLTYIGKETWDKINYRLKHKLVHYR